jgi:protoporphyrinogen oxidase
VRVAVIGAGVAGLTAAYRLTVAGHAVDVYERWPGLGGQAATFDAGGGVRLERYYHHLFTTDRHIAALFDELGLEDELEWRVSTTAMLARGRLWPFTTPGDLLRFSPLPPAARVRMGAAAVALQRFAGRPEPFEGVTARAWIERWMGRAAWREVWGPLLRGKFGERADDIAMVWLWSKLRLRRGEDARDERLGYPRRSWEPLLEALAERVRAGGGRVMTDRPAVRVEPAGETGRGVPVGAGGPSEGWLVTPGAPESFRAGHDPSEFAAAGDPERYDRVLATVPSDVFEQLLPPGTLPADYATRLRATEYFTALCLLLEVDRQVTPYYWINVTDRDLPFVGLIEHTNFVEPERYGGRRFLYVANYLPRGHELLSLDTEALLECYTPGLRRANPAWDRSWVRDAWRFAEPAAQPIVTVGYRDRIPPLRTGVSGLVLANTTQVYPEDRGTNYAVRLGDDAARAIMEP